MHNSTHVADMNVLALAQSGDKPEMIRKHRSVGRTFEKTSLAWIRQICRPRSFSDNKTINIDLGLLISWGSLGYYFKNYWRRVAQLTTVIVVNCARKRISCILASRVPTVLRYCCCDTFVLSLKFIITLLLIARSITAPGVVKLSQAAPYLLTRMSVSEQRRR